MGSRGQFPVDGIVPAWTMRGMYGSEQYIILLVALCFLMLAGVAIWGSIALSAAGRGLVWATLLAGSATPLLVLVGFVSEFSHLSRGFEALLNYLDYALEAGTLIFAVSFALHTRKVVSLAKRAKALEEECATLSSILESSAQS